MSCITIVDKRGGSYQALIEFTYGECERLPFNILRRIKAKIQTVPNGGIKATASFNIRTPHDSQTFLEVLDLFGEDGSFVHGSAADPAELARTAPPENTGTLYVAADNDDLEVEGPLGQNE